MKTLRKEKQKVNLEEKEKYRRSHQAGRTLRETIAMTTRPRKDCRQDENYTRY